jgi:prepilin-type processing-associated H-X9-DG protein
MLTVLAVIGIVASLLLPALAKAKAHARRTNCLSNQRQLGLAATLYMMDNNGSLFHHHEGWVLDDGTQRDELPKTLAECSTGGSANSHAEKPWAILFQPYLNNRDVGFCPADRTPRSRLLARDLITHHGGIATVNEQAPSQTEKAIAERDRLNMQSYLLNSIFTHRSCRYALDGSLDGFATEAALATLANPNLIMFSERNSEAMNAPDNPEFGSVSQDDYDTWVGEAAMVRWGSGKYKNEGWIRFNRHGQAANYIFADGHVEYLPWSKARFGQFPDRVVRNPVAQPPG